MLSQGRLAHRNTAARREGGGAPVGPQCQATLAPPPAGSRKDTQLYLLLQGCSELSGDVLETTQLGEGQQDGSPTL